MFYYLGSLLFALAMTGALAAMAGDFRRHRRAMAAALRGLDMDGLAPAPRPRPAPPHPAGGGAADWLAASRRLTRA